MGFRRPVGQYIKRELLRPSAWIWSVIAMVSMLATQAARPVEWLLGWPHDRPDSSSLVDGWPDLLAWLVMALAVQIVWNSTFGRDRRKAERAQLRADLLEGRIVRMPFAARVA